MELAFQQMEMFVNTIIQRINAIYFRTSLFRESLVNLDFLHSHIYYSIDKLILPNNLKTLLKNLFVSFYFTSTITI